MHPEPKLIHAKSARVTVFTLVDVQGATQDPLTIRHTPGALATRNLASLRFKLLKAAMPCRWLAKKTKMATFIGIGRFEFAKTKQKSARLSLSGSL